MYQSKVFVAMVLMLVGFFSLLKAYEARHADPFLDCRFSLVRSAFHASSSPALPPLSLQPLRLSLAPLSLSLPS